MTCKYFGDQFFKSGFIKLYETIMNYKSIEPLDYEIYKHLISCGSLVDNISNTALISESLWYKWLKF